MAGPSARFHGLMAWQAGEWAVLAIGALEGVLASVEAAKVHEEQEAAYATLGHR